MKLQPLSPARIQEIALAICRMLMHTKRLDLLTIESASLIGIEIEELQRFSTQLKETEPPVLPTSLPPATPPEMETVRNFASKLFLGATVIPDADAGCA